MISERSSVDSAPDIPRIWIKPHYASFNGLRGVAVAMTFLTHYAFLWRSDVLATLTWQGVDLFFVLSGFLITGILYDSVADPHYFRSFYIRRMLRILPVFYGFFLAVFVLTPILHWQWTEGLLAYFFYVGNVTTPFADIAHANPTVISQMIHGKAFPLFNVGHFWSLCVEEQFYLAWPAVVFMLRSRRALMRVCIAAAAFAVLLRFILFFHMSRHHGGDFIYWSTPTRMDTLLLGSWMALWLRGSALSQARLSRIAHSMFWGGVFALGSGLAVTHYLLHMKPVEFIQTIGYSLIAVVAGGVVLRLLDEQCLASRLVQWSAISRLGVVSYGFYVFHNLPFMPVERFADAHPHLRPLLPLLIFAAVYAIAEVSFRYYESPFLRLKGVLAPQMTGRLHVQEPRPDAPLSHGDSR